MHTSSAAIIALRKQAHTSHIARFRQRMPHESSYTSSTMDTPRCTGDDPTTEPARMAAYGSARDADASHLNIICNNRIATIALSIYHTLAHQHGPHTSHACTPTTLIGVQPTRPDSLHTRNVHFKAPRNTRGIPAISATQCRSCCVGACAIILYQSTRHTPMTHAHTNTHTNKPRACDRPIPTRRPHAWLSSRAKALGTTHIITSLTSTTLLVILPHPREHTTVSLHTLLYATTHARETIALPLCHDTL